MSTRPINDKELERLQTQEKFYEWSSTKKCPLCRDRMFWYPAWKKWLCRSWLFVQGGCSPYENVIYEVSK